jgi:acyl-coenzyme A synthetase/AMP-(fatty) acid ligase
MFSELILETCSSGRTAANRISDGRFDAAYGELPAVFEEIDEHLAQCNVSPKDFLAFRCSNNVFGAVFLLWALCRGRKILLTPPSTAQQRESGRHVDAPHFCRHVVSIEFSPEEAGLRNPGTYLRIDANASAMEESVFATSEPLVCLMTSGSMSSPKLIMHSAEKLAGNAAQCIDRFRLTESDRITIPVPIFHMYGLGAGFLPATIVGTSIDLQENSNLIKYLDREREFDPNKAFLTPGLCEMFLKSRRGGGRSYDLVVTAGDRISETNYLRFENGFGKLINLYGSTELGAIATSDPDKPLEIRAQGFLKPMDGVQTRIDELEITIQSDRDSGEIHIDHKFGFLSYFDASGKPVGQESGGSDWFPSKDIAVPAPDNYFRIIGRCDNSVNRSGRLLPLAEVETAVEKMEGVNRVIVVPRGESKHGKGMVAFCIPEQSDSLKVENIKEHCFAELPGYAIPDQILVIKEPPRLANGKIDLQALAENSFPRENDI